MRLPWKKVNIEEHRASLDTGWVKIDGALTKGTIVGRRTDSSSFMPQVLGYIFRSEAGYECEIKPSDFYRETHPW